MHQPIRFLSRILAFSAGSIVFSSVAFASGFQLFEYSAVDVGNFGAGGAAIAQDASTTFSNPAGMTRLPQSVSFGATIINSNGEFEGTACGGGACTPAAVDDNGGTTRVVPNFHYVIPFSDRWVFGFGATAPFGLATSWDDDKNLAYSATKSEIMTVNLNPSLAYKINNKWSVGVGADAMWMQAVLNSIIRLVPAGPPSAASTIHNKATDWGWGWNAGVLFTPSDVGRIGLSYRSEVPIHLTGQSRILGDGFLTALSTHAKADLTLPQTAMLSGFYCLNGDIDLMGSVLWTGWDSVKRLRFVNAALPTGVTNGTAAGVATIPENFDSTWRFAVGADYHINDMWRARIGLGFDQTPVNNTDRSIRLPDQDRTVVALGLKFSPNKATDIDFGYEHLFFKHADIHQIKTLSKSLGDVDARADLFGLQFTWNIDASMGTNA